MPSLMDREEKERKAFDQRMEASWEGNIPIVPSTFARFTVIEEGVPCLGFPSASSTNHAGTLPSTLRSRRNSLKNQQKKRKENEVWSRQATAGDDSSFGMCSTKSAGSFSSLSSLNENYNALAAAEKVKVKKEKDKQIQMLLEQKKAEKQEISRSDLNISKCVKFYHLSCFFLYKIIQYFSAKDSRKLHDFVSNSKHNLCI